MNQLYIAFGLAALCFPIVATAQKAATDGFKDGEPGLKLGNAVKNAVFPELAPLPQQGIGWTTETAKNLGAGQSASDAVSNGALLNAGLKPEAPAPKSDQPPTQVMQSREPNQVAPEPAPASEPVPSPQSEPAPEPPPSE